MFGKYSVEDLLKLRASPLICKPPTLPPIEEWMGTQDTAARRPTTRSKVEDQSVQNEPFQKRPTLLDGQRRTTTDPDRIVLGPPRRSFASSNARAAGKAHDGLDEKARVGDGKGTQSGGRHNRHESEEPDAEPRREYERKLKWGRDRSEQQELADDQAIEESRVGFRRDTNSRAKTSQSWFRKDAGDTLEEPRRETDRPQDWRTRPRDRDWDRSAKAEADPEWMDSAEPEEPFQAHTQEDFQRWKERMKAGTASQEIAGTAVTDSLADISQEKIPQKIVSPEPDDSMDKFFAKFGQQPTVQQAGPAKAATKTRFASLFSPAPEQNKQNETGSPVVNERPSSAQMPGGSSMDADQAGFARILEMLQTRSNNPTPQNQEQAKPRTPLYAKDPQPKTEGDSQPPSNLSSFLGNQNIGHPHDDLPHQPPANMERFPDPNYPVDQPTHTRQQSSINKDEVLLNLLRQANLAPKPQPSLPHQHSDLRAAGNPYGVSEVDLRPGATRGQIMSQGPDPVIGQRRETGRSMFDESPVSSIYHNDQGPREHLSRRPTNGSQLSYNDDPLMALLRAQPPGQHRMMQPSQMPQPPQGIPPGLQRPPGLDQMPRPNPSWAPQQPQPQQQQQPPARQPSLPPGLSGLPRGAPGGPYGQPQQIPTPQSISQHQQPQRPPPSRKYTGESPSIAGMPNFPPGMVPPPGFMNAGPPPGFPGPSLANHPVRYPDQQPQGVRGGFMELYGDMGGRGVGLRGGTGNSAGMPGYR